jgi:small conductance mechanosensitive channel
MLNIESSIERLVNIVITKIPSIVLGLVILTVGIYLIKLILKIVSNRFEKNEVDLSLRYFILSIIKFMLYAMLIITCASTMGIQTTSFLAVLSAASLAVGLSLQGSLSNFAGGVLILLFKPFRTGDNITAANGASGVVEKIDILYTTLRTSEGIHIFSPNGPLANSVITNYSNIPTRRIEYKLEISSKADINQVRNLILDTLSQDKRVLSNPAPQVLVQQLSNGSVTILVQFWATKEDYSGAFHYNQEQIKRAFDTSTLPIAIATQPEINVYTSPTK